MEPERSRRAVHVVAVMARLVERSLGELTLPQLRVLGMVERAPERAGRIAAEAGVSRPALTGVLDGLVARGLVHRTDVEGDRRGVQLEITAAGRATLAAAIDGASAALDELVASAPAFDRHLIEDGFEALDRAVEVRRRQRALVRPPVEPSR